MESTEGSRSDTSRGARPVALVTGASSGIGRAAAALFRANGFTVFGTSRRPERARAESGAEALLELDVRSDESVALCVAAVLERAGRIDVLVNNAGYTLVGEAEGTAMGQAQQQFETNFFGPLRLTNAVLPTMREQGSGNIVNVSSLTGLIGVPFMSMYSASKFALEGYTEALRLEVAPLGIEVSLVEPGFVNTPIAKGAKIASGTLAAYDHARGGALEAITTRTAAGTAAERVAAVILEAATARRPRLRYRVGRDSVGLPRLRKLIPARRFEAGTRKMFQLDTGAQAAPPS